MCILVRLCSNRWCAACGGVAEVRLTVRQPEPLHVGEVLRGAPASLLLLLSLHARAPLPPPPPRRRHQPLPPLPPHDADSAGRHWRAALQTGPQGRHWALECHGICGTGDALGTGAPAKGWHWQELGTGVPARNWHWPPECHRKRPKVPHITPFLLVNAIKTDSATLSEPFPS